MGKPPQPVRTEPQARCLPGIVTCPPAIPPAEDRMPAHLLLVEDDPLIRRSMSTRLRQGGHRVREADTVAAARGFLQSEPFDVALLDFRLPDGACNTWSALWHGLEALEPDLHHHIHLENNVLFPRLAAA